MRIGPSRLYRVVAPSLFCVWLAACADSTAPIGPPPQVSTVVVADSGGDFYYYQGQKMYLDVEPTRLVVEGIAPDRATNALRGLGIAVQRLERLPARDHCLIRLSAGTAKEQARSAVAALKANREFKFVSNAYKLRQTADDVLPLDRVIVSFKPSTSAARRDSLIAAFGMQVIRPPRPDSGFNYYVLAYPTDSASPLRVAAALDRHQLGAWAEPDKISNRHPDAVPSDAYYPLQYYLKNTVVRNGVTVDDNVESAW